MYSDRVRERGEEKVVYMRKRRRVFSLRRLLALSVLLFVCVFIAYHCSEKLARPYLLRWQEAREIARIKREIEAVESENRELRRQINYLQTAGGIQAEARKLGMVKEGEIALIVKRPEKNDLGSAREISSRSVWRNVISRIAVIFMNGRVSPKD